MIKAFLLTLIFSSVCRADFVDETGKIDVKDKSNINQQIKMIEQKHGNKIKLVFMKSLKGKKEALLAKDLFSNHNLSPNDVLFLVIEKEKSVRILVGEKARKYFNKYETRDLFDKKLPPLLKQKKYDELFFVIVKEIDQKLDGVTFENPRKEISFLALLGFSFFLGVAVLVMLFLRKKKK